MKASLFLLLLPICTQTTFTIDFQTLILLSFCGHHPYLEDNSHPRPPATQTAASRSKSRGCEIDRLQLPTAEALNSSFAAHGYEHFAATSGLTQYLGEQVLTLDEIYPIVSETVAAYKKKGFSTIKEQEVIRIIVLHPEVT